MSLRVLIADDHGLVRKGLRQVLAIAPDIEVVGEAAHGQMLLERLQTLEVDVVLLDMGMPGMSGVDLIRKLTEGYPGVATLVVSMHDEGQIVTRAIRAGAAGYITKDADPELLVAAIRRVGGGGRFIDPAVVDCLVFPGAETPRAPHEQLSPREIQILELIAAGQIGRAHV